MYSTLVLGNTTIYIYFIFTIKFHLKNFFNCYFVRGRQVAMSMSEDRGRESVWVWVGGGGLATEDLWC
jgi:hypothetical protein